MNLQTFICEQNDVGLWRNGQNSDIFKYGSLMILNGILTWTCKNSELNDTLIINSDQIGIAIEDWSAERPRIKLYLVGHSFANEVIFEFRRDSFQEVFSYIRHLMTQRKASNLSSSRFNFKGITAIERSISENLKIQEQSISNAFTDLQMLMNCAGNMVTLAKSIASKVQDFQSNSLDGSDITKFRSYLLSLGMVANPVVKDFACRDFHKQLCIELVNLIRPFIKRYGGILNLADAYCILNRARGLNPVSPSDLAYSCELLSKYCNDISLIKFESGVIALATTSTDSDEKILNAIKDNGGHITAALYSGIVNLSQMLAFEHLQRAEQNGLLCRDEHLSSVCFYPNIFLHNFNWFQIT